MPLPKIRDGQKLSLMLPADVIERVRSEAADEGMIPAMIILAALDEYWGGNSEAANPTTDPTPRQRKALSNLLHHLEDLIINGTLTVAEIAEAAGVPKGDFQGAWRTAGFVPVASGKPVVKFLQARNLPLSRRT
jgi:hypothetical protein